MLEGYRYIDRFRVAFFEIDMLRHTNHIAYIRWTETARCAYFAEVLGEDITGRRGCIAARLEVDYRAPLEYLEKVAVGCRISRFGNKSFDTEYEIWSETHGILAANLYMKCVAYDYTQKKSIPIPDEWRKIVAEYEPLAPT
ncbi:MAG: thioesterase family protein [Vulcanimicrobiaceae bacterium]